MASKEERKRRELEIGLANNAVGAGAGTIATVGAYRALRRAEPPRTRVGQWAMRQMGRARISPRRALVAAGAGNIALQAGNGLLDAQSAGYFARERAKMGSASKALMAGGGMFDQSNGAGVSLVAKAKLPVPKAVADQAAALAGGDARLARRYTRSRMAPAQRAANAARKQAAQVASMPRANRERLAAVNQTRAARQAGSNRNFAAMDSSAQTAAEQAAAAREGLLARRARYQGASAGQKLVMGGQDLWGGMSPGAKAKVGGGALLATGGVVGGAKLLGGGSSSQIDPYTGLAKANYTVPGKFGGGNFPRVSKSSQRVAVKHLRLRSALEEQIRRGKARPWPESHLEGVYNGYTANEPKNTAAARRALRGVSKARRFDPEADRQRRMGLYAGAGLGGAAVAGQQAAQAGAGLLRSNKKIVGFGFKDPARRGKAGALVATSGALGALGVAAYRRGISERNQPWA